MLERIEDDDVEERDEGDDKRTGDEDEDVDEDDVGLRTGFREEVSIPYRMLRRNDGLDVSVDGTGRRI